MPTDETMQALFEVFRTDAVDVLDELSELVHRLRLEEGTHLRQLAKTAMRLAHNLKGAGGSVGHVELAQLAHALEDALQPCCSADAAPPDELSDAMHRAVVFLEQLVQTGDDCEASTREECAALRERLVRLAGEYAARSAPARGNTGGPHSVASSLPDRTLASGAPEADTGSPDSHSVSYLRIAAPRLDELAHHVDRMLVLRGQQDAGIRALEHALEELETALRKSCSQQGSYEGELSALRTTMHASRQSQRALARQVSDLGACVRSARMVPMAALVPLWRRVVRDTAHQLGKSARLQADVGGIQLDKHVLDALRDPFLHLLRNAVDHGIESTEERFLLGKPAEGTITIEARAGGGRVTIVIHDDGRGIDSERVGRLAVEKGLVSAQQLESLSVEDTLEFVFHDGLSSAKAVSEVSGRGVGLAALRAATRQLGGRCSLASSVVDEGTTFELSVPVTVLATRGLLVASGGVTYVLPTDIVQRALRCKPREIRTTGGHQLLPVAGGEPLRLRWLVPGERAAASESDDYLRIVVLAQGSRKLGLVISEVLGEHECVIRRLPWNLQRMSGINGAVVLPDGAVALVLDAYQLFVTTEEQAMLGDGIQHFSTEAASSSRILVADDSLTSRTLERNILVAAGYIVDVAADGSEAWKLLRSQRYDMLVADVQMPGMDGFELTRAVRANPELANLPVILVTALGRSQDIAEGAAAGADEYLVKGQLEHDKLLEAVGRHLFDSSSQSGGFR